MNEQTTTNTAAHDEPLAVLPPVDDDAAGREAVREKMADALTPGFQVEFDPDEAERVGAFVEDALSEQDAAAIRVSSPRRGTTRRSPRTTASCRPCRRAARPPSASASATSTT